MAYVQNVDEQNQPGAGVNMDEQQMPQTSSGGGDSPAAAASAGASAVPAQSKAPPVQDLSAYLRANAPQAVQMGQNIAGNLKQTSNKVTGDINADQAAFDQGVQAQNVAPNAGLVQQAAAAPETFVQDPNNVAAFQKQRTAKYSGPQTYESSANYQGLQNSVTSAMNNAPDINKPGGVQQLVRGQEKNPTVGQSNLDTLILQQNAGALNPIKDALASYPKLQDLLTGAASTENKAIQNTVANNAAAQKGVQDAFNATVPGWQKGLTDNLAKNQTQATQYNSTLSDYLATLNKNQPFKSALDESGLISSLGLQNPFPDAPKQITGSPTLANTASDNDYARDAALESLLQESYSPVLSQDTRGQAGSFSVPTTPVPQAPNIRDLLNQITDASYRQQYLPAYEKSPLAGAFNGNPLKILQGQRTPYQESGSMASTPMAESEAYENFLRSINPIYGDDFLSTYHPVGPTLTNPTARDYFYTHE